MTDCAECAVAAGAPALGVAPLRIGAFVVHPKPEAPPVPGWMVVAPARHVEQIDDLSDEEQRELGPLLARVAAALRANTSTARIYVSIYAEVLPHLHVHLIARPPDRPALGARVFLEPPGAAEGCRAVARRVLDYLEAATP